MINHFHYQGTSGQCRRTLVNRMISDAVQVSYDAMRKYCPKMTEWSVEKFGYSANRARGLTLRDDSVVKFFHSKIEYEECYFAVIRSVEHIFLAKPSGEKSTQAQPRRKVQKAAERPHAGAPTE